MESVTFNVKQDFNDRLSNDFETFANGLTAPCVVVLEIESNGGEAQALEKMCNRISQMKKDGFVFVTNVENYAYSCAFILFLIGDMRFASDVAMFVDHPPTIKVDDRVSASDAKEIFEILDYFQNVRDKIVSENTNISPEAFSLLKKNETFMDRNDLIFLGLMENEYKL
jgi:ATP-dependent protease ClpP protease subunit